MGIVPGFLDLGSRSEVPWIPGMSSVDCGNGALCRFSCKSRLSLKANSEMALPSTCCGGGCQGARVRLLLAWRLRRRRVTQARGFTLVASPGRHRTSSRRAGGGSRLGNGKVDCPALQRSSRHRFTAAAGLGPKAYLRVGAQQGARMSAIPQQAATTTGGRLDPGSAKRHGCVHSLPNEVAETGHPTGHSRP